MSGIMSSSLDQSLPSPQSSHSGGQNIPFGAITPSRGERSSGGMGMPQWLPGDQVATI